MSPQAPPTPEELQRVLDELDPLDHDDSFLWAPREAFRDAVIAAIREAIAPSRRQVLRDYLLGLGPIESIWHGDRPSELAISASGLVHVREGGRMVQSPVVFPDPYRTRILKSIAARDGKQLTHQRPLVGVTVGPGERAQLVGGQVSVGGGASAVFRRQTLDSPSLELLAELGSIDKSLVDLLRAEVLRGRNFLVAGDKGSGKTTFLSALIEATDPAHHVVTMEDVGELKVPASRCVTRLATRNEGNEGTGGVDHAALLRAAKRLGADVLVLGEVRGSEAYALVDALTSATTGVFGGIHARDAQTALDKLANKAVEGGADPRRVQHQVRTAVDYVVHLLPDLARRPALVGGVAQMGLQQLARPVLCGGQLAIEPVVTWVPNVGSAGRWVIDDPGPFVEHGLGQFA